MTFTLMLRYFINNSLILTGHCCTHIKTFMGQTGCFCPFLVKPWKICKSLIIAPNSPWIPDSPCIIQSGPKDTFLTSIASLMLFLISWIFCFFSLWRTKTGSCYFLYTTAKITRIKHYQLESWRLKMDAVDHFTSMLIKSWLFPK